MLNCFIGVMIELISFSIEFMFLFVVGNLDYFYCYFGSFIILLCYESVVWIIFENVILILE